MIRNREELFQSLQGALDEAVDGSMTAIVMLRVHGLHELSLRFGYEQAEQAQAAVKTLVAQCLRPIDRVFRIGDDRYALVLPRLRHRNHVLLAAARLAQAFEHTLGGAPWPWQGRPSMGIALAPEHGLTPDLLSRRADIALDEAHRRGELWATYLPDATQVEIFYDELREAISNNRLEVYFQPVWQLQERRISGAESLARWTRPEHGPVSPGDFVPFAEQSDLIFALTRWSVNATLRHASELRHVPGLTFAINASPRVLNRSGMVEQLLGALTIWNLPPSALIIEITETAYMSDPETSEKVLRRLRDQGMRIAIDDFGSGYASISYLRRLPATEVKIDQSLVLSMQEDPRTDKLVQAVIDMAHRLDLTTVAEGIETEASLQRLVEMGCDYGQGYHLGHPQPANAFIERFAD